MQQAMPIHDAVVGAMGYGRGPGDHLSPRGTWHIEHIRDGAVLREFDVPNAVTNAAKNDLLNVYFNASARSSVWSIGLIDGATFTATSAADTPSSHAGWTEYANYSIAGGATNQRGSWTKGTPAGQQITNAAAVVFTFTNASGAVWGIFVISDSTKGGTAGMLWSTAAFNAPLNVQVGDVLNVTYTIQL